MMESHKLTLKINMSQGKATNERAAISYCQQLAGSLLGILVRQISSISLVNFSCL